MTAASHNACFEARFAANLASDASDCNRWLLFGFSRDRRFVNRLGLIIEFDDCGLAAARVNSHFRRKYI